MTDALLVRLVEAAHLGAGPSTSAAVSVGEQLARSLDAPLSRGEQAADVVVLLSVLRDELHPSSPLRRLGSTADLSAKELEVLAVLSSLASDPRRGRLMGWLNDDPDVRSPTLGTLTSLFGDDPEATRAVGPHGGLARACLLADVEPAGCWADTPVVLHPDVLWWLRSDGCDLPLAGRQQRQLTGTGTASFVVAAGPDRERRLQAVDAVLAARQALVGPAPEDEQACAALVRAATLAGAAVVLEVADHLPMWLAHRIARATHLPFAVSSPLDLPVASLPDRPWLQAPVGAAAASPDERAAVLPDEAAVGEQLTADQLQQIERVLPAVGGEVDRALRRIAAAGMSRLSQRIVPSRTWDDLVLPQVQRDQVCHLIARARHRDLVYGSWGFSPRPSRGVVAMLVGPSGTGKTLTAEVVAGELGLDVYRVDLSQLVDKYIGETEKNLSQAFDAAAANPVVLFFDEADAVLGRRSSVSDSSDRFANLQVAHLLQRLEHHDGVVLLASNLPGNVDPAFLRRLHVTVQFPVPGREERCLIWRRCVPAAAPQDDLDLAALADRFELTGGSIRNAAQTAAFLAAEAGSPLTFALLEQAARDELIKEGRLPG